MFRASLRSLTDPLREHVCLSCLAQGLGGRPRVRQFYNCPPRANSGGDQTVDEATHVGDDSSAPPTTQKDDSPPKRRRKRAPRPTLRSKDDITESIVRKLGSKTRSHDDTPSVQEELIESLDQDVGRSPKRAAKRERKKSDLKIRKVASKEKKKPGTRSPSKSVKSGGEGEFEDNAASTARIQSSLQSVVSLLQSRATTPKDRESVETLSAVTGASQGKDFGALHSQDLSIMPLNIQTSSVPQLSFGLERVLFNPGVYHLRDPRSRVFNFDPYLGSIMPVTEFDFDALKEYITSSRDEILRGIAAKEKKKYVGSSSSMTSVLSHFHYLLSAWRPIDASTLSQGFPDKLRTFTRLLRAPSAMFLRYQDGVYAIDADKEFDSANILMNLGKSLEKLLTLPKEDFERYRRTSKNKISAEEEQAIPEAYHYSTMGDFIMRSQLDAYDPRLPGTGMFDLKTRAVVSIRMDVQNFEHGLGYEIRRRFGTYESYEREYFDMIRAAFLKYSLQVRIGRMDGIFVAFHNIERIFGFQYVSLPEMDESLHGQSDTSLGDAEFQLSLALWNKILDKATAKFPKRSLRFHFETRDAQTPFMYIFAEPVTDEEIHAIQTKNQEKIEAYQQRILNLTPKGQIKSSPPPPAPNETEVQPSTPEAKADEASGTAEPPQEPLPIPAAEKETSDPSKEPESAPAEPAPEEEPPRELLAMTLVIKNKLNGFYVERPLNFKASDDWTVQWELTELQDAQAQPLYTACQKRRQKALAGRGEDESDIAANVYIRKLREISRQGRKYRQQEDKLDKGKRLVVLGDPV